MSPSNGHRLGVVDDAGRGTPAATWHGWSDRLPDLDATGWATVVVVAPHPDDEVLGVGGLIRRFASIGSDVQVVAVTDGGAARPPSGWSGERLSRERVREAAAGCRALGVLPPLRLDVPDGAVAAHEDSVTEALTRILTPDTYCLATWRSDGHPDHEASGRAAARACARTGATLVEYPVWMWHWSRPEDSSVPWHRARRVVLTPTEAAAKARAVQYHRTQLDPPAGDDDPVLPPFVLERLVTGEELVLL